MSEQDMALDEWMSIKSKSMGRRVEALSAFYRRCQRDGFGRATPDEFEAKFQDFMAMKR